MKENKEYFDLSESSIDWLHDNTNKKKLGCFKDENNSYPITKFLSLSPKVYSFLHDSSKGKDNEKKVCKGISKSVIKKDLKSKDYKDLLDTGESISKEVTSIRSIDQEIFTITTNKVALTAYQDKSYICDNGIDCLPFGYYKKPE